MKRRLLLTIGLNIVLTFLFALVVFIIVPETIIAHMNWAGEVTRTGSRREVLLVPLFTAVPQILFYFLWRYQLRTINREAERSGARDTEKTLGTVILSASIVMTVFSTVSFAINYYMAARTLEMPKAHAVIILFILAASLFNRYMVLGKGRVFDTVLPLLAIGIATASLRFVAFLPFLTVFLIIAVIYFTFTVFYRKDTSSRA